MGDPRFKGIEPFKNKVWLSSPTMHGDEQRWVDEAIQTNWVSTVGENINEVERMVAEKIGRKYAVAFFRHGGTAFGCETVRGKTIWSAEGGTRNTGREESILLGCDV